MSVNTTTQDYIKIAYGLLRRASPLAEFFRTFAADAFRKNASEVTDEQINSVFLLRFLCTTETRTISASEKGIPEQYKSADYFDSVTLNLSEFNKRMIEETLLKLQSSSNPDITEILEEHFRTIKRLQIHQASQLEKELRQAIGERMHLDGMVSKTSRTSLPLV